MADNIYDVCVIGAGIVGSFAAYSALKYSKSVVLCDQFPLGHSRGSSHGHSRIIRKSYIQEHYAKMMPEAYDIWKEIENESGCEQLLLTTGLLTLEGKPYENIHKMRKHLKGLNADYEYLDNAALRKKFPMLDHPDTHEAIFEPTGGLLKADKCIATVQSSFKRKGGIVKECFKVSEIKPGQIVTLIGKDSQVKARNVILAAGPWTNDILRAFGFNLPLQTMKINVCYWKADDAAYSSAAGFPCFIEYTNKDGNNWHLYGLPNLEYPNLLKVCAHYGQVVHPDNRDEETEAPEVQVVADYLSRFFKGVEGKPTIVEKCYYTWTPDEDFIIDYVPSCKNIVVGAGFSGHGFKLAPVTGKILAQLALGIRPNYDISPLSVSRLKIKANL